MTTFIEWLTAVSERDTRVRATLRRSLAFQPGAYAPAFPYVEPFLKGDPGPWQRDVHYLIAALWSRHRSTESGDHTSLGHAAAILATRRDSASSIERRLVALLDADSAQLYQRIRQMLALLDEIPVDWHELLKDLLAWNSPHKHVQNRWARDFYRNSTAADENEDESTEEQNQ